ncbi:asparagine synthase (glutamine-hydrolyzing) [Azospirillum agricola]|uniref:asparagine synthase (glutamine-hydrolyzing) n=1 Tax=Azospirillum agricola TaxID=1720247 RepID=UPI000A0F125A|nr:asparagine synthase (glutamine-hydrolyzing) [Azospirillum agricola]SMH57934.1 asparagine synthase (glutamine-hydrolysing) [Azospirillum lipoferum]
MCGFCGFLLDADGRAASAVATAGGFAAVVGRMNDRIAHRGPDGDGLWADEPAGMALGHRRLAIVELSPLGRQPMESADGRLVIAYNGEIYNFPELRAELEAAGHRFRGQSDTEVLVEACAAWGIGRAVRRLVGIFAFALWDRHERALTLVRDPLGVKPLYWTRQNGALLFGSQPKALRAHPAFTAGLDRDALAAYLRFSYVPAPHSIFEGVRKLEPGRILTVRPGREPEETVYWDVATAACDGLANPLALSDAEATDALEELLSDAVGRQMMADVPLGAFLSGGVDSSAVVALMARRSDRPVRSFTIGFREGGYDEAEAARAVARHLGTDHTELVVEPRHALDTIPNLPEWYDEPFADSSQIPTVLVSQLTRKSVTVALSGDGGDELFAGYNRYLWGDSVWRRMAPLPPGLRRTAAGMIQAVRPGGWDALFGLLPEGRRPRQPGDKLHKLAGVLASPEPDALYRRLVSQWDDPDAVVRGGREPKGLVWDAELARRIPGFVPRMQLLDSATYLPDDILAKVDRASMGVGLEARVPLLDHRVVEFAWRVPLSQKIRDGQGKWLLRQVLYRHVPKELIERPKSGFAVPIDAWLRGPLRDWAEDLLSESALRSEGWFDPATIRACWTEHLSGTRNNQHRLWNVLMFQAWTRHWARSAAAAPLAA